MMSEAEDLYFELAAVSEHFRRTMEGADRKLLRGMEAPVKRELSHELGRVTRSVDDVRRALALVCSFCRKPGGVSTGDCEQCGQPACSNCSRDVNGHVLHLGSCASFFREDGKTG